MITAYTLTRSGDMTTVTVTSDLVGTVYYHWYVDGVYYGATRGTSKTIHVGEDQARVEVVDTLAADFDPAAHYPPGSPARVTLFWLRSLAADTDHYRIEAQEGGGEWTSVGRGFPRFDQWYFTWLTARLSDITVWSWRIVPVDRSGNDGTPLALGGEIVVRQPDAPEFTATYDEDTELVTFSVA